MCKGVRYGRSKSYTQFIIGAAWSLAMYRVLRAQGETLEAVGELIMRWIGHS